MITTIATHRNLRIASFAAGAAAIAAAAVYMTASAAGYSFNFGGPKAANVPAAGTMADKSSTTASGVCNEFAAHFSSDLGVSQDKVNSAFQQAVGQTLADEVKAGHITQAQADAITKKMAGQAPCTLAGTLGGRNAASGAVYQQALLSAAASALGITADTLKADLAKGMTLHQIANAQNPPVTEAQFRSKLIAGLKPALDKAVTDKKITSAQEQKILTALQTGPIPFWDKPMRKPAAAASPGA